MLPIGHKDFGPYFTKILASGAEIIFTGNYGVDLANLIKQGAQMGIKLPVRYATYFMDDDVQLPEHRPGCGRKFCEQHISADDRHSAKQSFPGTMA